MNSYSHYANEITADELYDGLVGFGLFAEKIPGFLASETFLNFTKTLDFPLNVKDKDYIRYSSMRNTNVNRPMAIPEPFAYANQCKSLSDNWELIKNHFEAKTLGNIHKISRIHIRKLFDRSELFEMNYKNFSKDGDPEQDIVIKSKYLANADISTCFPSIYSHSIAWALVTKVHCKTNRDQLLWFNKLDYYTRNVKHGETNGVLIGPHASNLISEIILVAVDFELSKHNFRFIRNIDDYTCYVETCEEAESFFLILSDELKKYELSLNSKKSSVVPLPQATVKRWVTKLNHFNFTNSYIKAGKEAIRIKELKGFIDYAIELMLAENSDASVLNYAIKIISNKYLGENAKNYYIKQIHHLVLLYPYLINLIDANVFETHNVDKEIIKNIAIDIYQYGIKKKSYEACSFAIFWACKYGFTFGVMEIKDDAINSSDCIFLMISYLYDSKYNRKSYLKEYKDEAKRLKNYDFDRYWLFIYEVLPYKDLSENYRIMKKAGLTFVKLEQD